MYIWNYVFQIFMIRYWEDCYRGVPVFRGELPDDELANFQHTRTGINDIILSTNQRLTDRELMGVLLHEMCHHVVFEEHGYDVAPHGSEWASEMRRIGFEDPTELTDGTNFFSQEQYHEIMDLVEGI